MDKKEKAKAIIVEIIHQSGGCFEGKIKLFKAFYLAHLFHIKDGKDDLGQLSEWGIVKMPNGPGIDRYSDLMCDLIEQGVIQITSKNGNYSTINYSIINQSEYNLTNEEVESIKKASDFVNSKTARELSRITHEDSNCWKDESVMMGDDINIVGDSIEKDRYEKLKAATLKARKFLEKKVGGF